MQLLTRVQYEQATLTDTLEKGDVQMTAPQEILVRAAGYVGLKGVVTDLLSRREGVYYNANDPDASDYLD